MLEQRPDSEGDVEATVVKDTGDAVIVPAVQGVQVGRWKSWKWEKGLIGYQHWRNQRCWAMVNLSNQIVVKYSKWNIIEYRWINFILEELRLGDHCKKPCWPCNWWSLCFINFLNSYRIGIRNTPQHLWGEPCFLWWVFTFWGGASLSSSVRRAMGRIKSLHFLNFPGWNLRDETTDVAPLKRKTGRA